jgi:AcrR family transcriptional regulator
MGTEPSPKSRRVSRIARRDLLLEAARETFLAKGYAGAAVRTIAERAGVTEAMVYRHFSSKEELFDEAIAEPLEHAVTHILDVALDPEPGNGIVDVRERAISTIGDLLGAMQEIAPTLGVLFAADAERGHTLYRERLQPAIDAVRDVTAANLPLWTHREFDSDLIARIAFGICWFLAIDGKFGSRPMRPPGELAPEIINILFDGLITRETDESSTAPKVHKKRSQK